MKSYSFGRIASAMAFAALSQVVPFTGLGAENILDQSSSTTNGGYPMNGGDTLCVYAPIVMPDGTAPALRAADNDNHLPMHYYVQYGGDARKCRVKSTNGPTIEVAASATSAYFYITGNKGYDHAAVSDTNVVISDAGTSSHYGINNSDLNSAAERRDQLDRREFRVQGGKHLGA